MKRRLLISSLLILSALLLTSCTLLPYKIWPGTQADFERMPNGAKVISAEITEKPDYKYIIQQPGAYFMKESRGSDPGGQGATYVFSSGAEAYMELLVDIYGFEMVHENLNFVYNTWYFIHPDNNKNTDNYITEYDVKVRHYYDASTSTTSDWLDVSIDTDLYEFGDLGLRYNKDLQRSIINGTYAKDAFLLNWFKYSNSSNGKLSVRSGVKKDTLYTYTKPFASQFYGFYGYDGSCSLIINSGKAKSYDALLSDYEDFDSDSTDMIFISAEDGSELLKITWWHNEFEVGKIYDLSDFNIDDVNDFEFNYDYNEFTDEDAICLTVRPLWLDRSGDCESVIYFYGEFMNDDGDIYTVEGLLAAPFCLEENSKKYTSGSSGQGGGGLFDDIFDNDNEPYIPDHSKLDCLTCRGDGDCNSCGGTGIDYYGSHKTKCNTCYGSGNCRSCNGSGKR